MAAEELGSRRQSGSWATFIVYAPGMNSSAVCYNWPVMWTRGDEVTVRVDRLSHGGKAQPPEVLVLDPPRAGGGAKVTAKIARLLPARIVYISCNPATLALDLRDLVAAGYKVTAGQPLDLFPHTYHVECVVRPDRSSGV